MSDKEAELVDAITKIHGPTAAELRQPYEKSLDQLAAELRQRQYESVEAAMREGQSRTNKGGK